MTSLFSSFDSYYFPGKITFFFISMFVLFSPLYKTSVLSHFYGLSFNLLTNFFYSLKPKMFNKISGALFISLFILVIVMNFMSVFSFNFPLSSQVSMILVSSLGIWVSLIIFSLMKNLKGFFSHLVPEGAPLFLSVLLFLIELVSNVIRPLTLMVRLVANILAGHLLMILLSSMVFSFPLSFLFYTGLNLVELAVAVIQAYIFTTMTVLYFSEV